ncbi:hypothetical protein B5E64_15280 [Drancourtella sp. An12]|nr:hypothetical protein B5E64_15280 [Drancourtella sp. An12]
MLFSKRKGAFFMDNTTEFLYNLINPSDPYTFRAEDQETAALAVFCLGPAYGAENLSGTGSGDVPVLLFSDPKVWYQEQFGRTPDEGLEAKKPAVIRALKSFILGNERDRKRYEAAMACIREPERREVFVREWRDGRTSMNNIGLRAEKMAEALEKQREDQEEKGASS